MIEKFDDQNGFCMADCMNKMNEVIDTVNNIQKEREAEWFEIQEWIGILEAVRKSVNIHEKQIDELQMKLEPEKCETPAENVLTKSLRMEKEFAEEECKRLQTELDCTRKELEQSETCCSDWEKQALDYKAENINLSDKIGKLETELERTRKALDVALCSLQNIAESDGDFITGASTPLDEHEYADMMLKEIKRQMKIKTALEQKDVK